MRKTVAIVLAIFLAMNTFHSVAQASVIVHTKKYANCKELNAKYPGGVAKSSNSVNKGGVTKLTPFVSAKIYKENIKRDRDKDGIACER